MQSHIDIQIKGKSLALPEDFSLDIEEKNPMFYDNEMFSYPVQMPLEGNREIVKNVDDVQADVRPVELEHEVLFILFMSSARIAFLISSDVRDESIMRAVDAPMPDTPIRRRKSSRSSFVKNP